MKPKTLTIGTATDDAAELRRIARFSSTRRMASTPFSSSPWIAAESQRRGPGRRPCRTVTGRWSWVCVGSRATGRSKRSRVPGRTSWPPDRKGRAGRESGYPLMRSRVRFGDAVSSMYLIIAPATSLPLASSMPSSPGEELTSMTTGPWFERSMSTPQTRSPIAFAERTAVLRSSGVSLIRLARAAAVEVGAELALRALPLHRRDHAVADDEGADVGAAAPP